MITRRERLALRKLESLRSTRLRLAELNVSKALAAKAEAEELVERMREKLTQTAAFCAAEHQRLAGELSNAVKEGKEGIDKWKLQRVRLREKFNEAKQNVEQAKEICREKEKEVEVCRARQREATLAVEKLKILMSKIG